MPPEKYDLIVIGSGPAGEKGAAAAAYFGKAVALVEKEPVLGGAAANTGTIPSKTLRESALLVRSPTKRKAQQPSRHHDHRQQSRAHYSEVPQAPAPPGEPLHQERSIHPTQSWIFQSTARFSLISPATTILRNQRRNSRNRHQQRMPLSWEKCPGPTPN